MYAIIETGGKQYKVREGETVDVELLSGEAGDTIELNQVLLVAGHDRTQVGTPTVDGAVVRATVVDEVKGDKIVVFKYKPKNRYRRKTGHRQKYTRLQIDRIIVPGMEEQAEEVAELVEEGPVVEAAASGDDTDQPAFAEEIAAAETDSPEKTEEPEVVEAADDEATAG